MNSETHTFPNPAPAERWLLVVGDHEVATWQARLQRQTKPLLQWRLLHGLAGVVQAGQLRGAVQSAVRAGAPRVCVRSTLGREGTLQALAGDFETQEDQWLDVRLIDPLRFDHVQALLAEPAQPDRGVLAHYLLSQRKEWLLHPYAGCVQAMQAWAVDFEADVGAQWLQDVFDAAPLQAEVVDSLEAGTQRVTTPAPQWKELNLPVFVVSDIGRGADNDSESYGDGLMSASSAASHAAVKRQQWTLNAPSGGTVVVEFTAPACIETVDEATGGTLSVTLKKGALRDATGLHLTLRPSGFQAPVRLPLGAAADWRELPNHGHRRRTHALAPCSEALAQAIEAGRVELEFHEAPATA